MRQKDGRARHDRGQHREARGHYPDCSSSSVDIRKTIYDRQDSVRSSIYLEDLQTLVDQQKELEVQKSKLHEAEAALAAITDTRAQTEAEYRRTLYGELAEAEQQGGGPCAAISIKATSRPACRS